MTPTVICLNLTTVSFPGESPLPIQVRGSNKSARAVILDGSCSSQKHTSVYSCNEGAGASIFQVNNVNISQVTRTDFLTDNGTSRPTEKNEKDLRNLRKIDLIDFAKSLATDGAELNINSPREVQSSSKPK